MAASVKYSKLSYSRGEIVYEGEKKHLGLGIHVPFDGEILGQ